MGETKLNGAHVLAGVGAFVAIIIVVNAIFITLAVESFPGQVVDKPYETGLNYNDVLAAKAAQKELGWTAEIERAALDGADAEIAIRFRAASGDTLHLLEVAGELRRPASDVGDQALMFAQGVDGAYVARVQNIAAGVWDLRATARAPTGENFVLEKRLVLQ